MLPAPPDFSLAGFHPPDAAPALPGYPSSSYLFGSAASASAGQNATAQQPPQQQQSSGQQSQGSEALNAVHLQYYQMQRAQVRSLLCGLLIEPARAHGHP